MGIALITNNIVSDSNIAIAALSPSYAAGGVTSTGVSTLAFSNANGVSFGINGNTITGSIPTIPAGGISVSAGASSANISSLVFSNLNGVSFGLNGSTITASAAGGGGGTVAAQSYYENMPLFGATATVLLGTGVSNYFQPFNLPYDVSASYIRMPVAMSFASTSIASANSSLSLVFSESQTMYFNIYTMGTGVNSQSLQLYTSASASMAMAWSLSWSNSDSQTVRHSISYPFAGGSATATASNSSQTNVMNIGTAGLTNFNGSRQFDIPFAASLSEGAYWMGIQRSTQTSASTQVSSLVSNATFQITNIGVSQPNSNYNYLGNVSNSSTNGLQLGLGVYSASATGATTGSIAMSQLSTVASQPRFPFQLIRQA